MPRINDEIASTSYNCRNRIAKDAYYPTNAAHCKPKPKVHVCIPGIIDEIDQKILNIEILACKHEL